MKNLNLKLRMLLTIMACMILLTYELFAQEKINYKQLRGKEWILQVREGVELLMSYTYTIDSCFVVAKHSKMRGELKSVYYLSDDWNGTFDDTKVGVSVAGKYLVEKRNNEEKKKILINVYEILKLTETDLELRNVEGIELTEGGEELDRYKNDIITKYKSKQE